jgi:hypothetical protein
MESNTYIIYLFFRIRDLNDEINKLMREKGHWERRIVELGGPDYSRAAPRTTDSLGREVAELTGKQISRCMSSCTLPIRRCIHLIATQYLHQQVTAPYKHT